MASEDIVVPDGFRLHTENTSHILLEANEAFLNPVQEFNRDLSVAFIRVWSEELHRVKKEKWLLAQERRQTKSHSKQNKRPKLEEGAVAAPASAVAETETETPSVALSTPPEFSPKRITILEALSATGLRSIRYAKEIPHVSHILANDLSPAATAAMRRNIEINGLTPKPDVVPRPVEIRVNEGDACALMYNHRETSQRVDVVDLDPYGTAAPFIDAAVQCIRDDGLLCVTCTDLSVLATTNFPEKCYSNYGGVPVKTEYCHEAALRLVLHSVSTSAARYGRVIEPLASLSIDFYVRLFIRIRTSPIEVKKAITKTSTYLVCADCQSFYGTPLGKVIEKTGANGNINLVFKLQAAPAVTDKCPECDGALHVAGPMWSAPIHDTEFVGKVLEHVEANQSLYGTASRMQGMLSLAKEELPDKPFYFTPPKVSKFFHCETPSLSDVISALLHGGHQVARSHASAGSIKTSATRGELFDIYRSWINTHPVRSDRFAPGSPALRLLNREIKSEANFATHPDAHKYISRLKFVRYPENPPNWGPKAKASSAKESSSSSSGKRKRGADE